MTLSRWSRPSAQREGLRPAPTLSRRRAPLAVRSTQAQFGLEVSYHLLPSAGLPARSLPDRIIFHFRRHLHGHQYRARLVQYGLKIGGKVLQVLEGEGTRIASATRHNVIGHVFGVWDWLPAGSGVAFVVEQEVIEIGRCLLRNGR